MTRWKSAREGLGIASGRMVVILMGFVMWMIFAFAPEETTMGPVQRVMYLHVSVAWCGLMACIAMGATGAVYLMRRNGIWDQWSQAAAEIGWLCATLTLVTGSLWAHEAWNTWWTWEPRLTASLILWMVFAGYFVIRSSIEVAEQRARICAVLAVLALADVPMVVMATRWFRGMHPVSPELDPRMRVVLLISAVSFTALFTVVVALRFRCLNVTARLTALEGTRGIGA